MLHLKQQTTFAANRIKKFMPVIIAAAALPICFIANNAVAQNHYAANKQHHAAGNRTAVAPDPANSRTILGDVVPFGNGTARSWVRLDGKGDYTSIGVTLTEDALKGLPSDVTPGLIWMVEYILNLPAEAKMLPFKHIAVNWNPKGHMPSGVYNVPHFDFHFYTSSREERSKITARGNDLELCRKAPENGHVPEGYIFAPESEEPGMGGHWVDGSSHEFHGKDFTSTFIYGSYNGKVIFWEPMITKAYLESKVDVTIPLKLPRQYDTAGYYPTSYSITYDENRKEYTVAFDGMTLRQATTTK